ncbi:MAG: 7-carboxy-7-deazaguanine synthase QueE [Oligoflexia bacterium]|nr:7-carboxy-7-deazaguanine synthase QueE [Oligoflexia bacterium]
MLKLNEIFFSIQGESSANGRPCIFIRLSGCKLRCTYCDTKYAYYEGEETTIDAILNQIRQYPSKFVEVTGGEPMEQEETPLLLETLLKSGYEVFLETDGVEDLSKVPAGVTIVMDVKTPGSKMANPKSEKNLSYLKPQDEIKFVICDQRDYLFAKDFIQKHQLENKHKILMSPVMPQENLQWLPEQILKDGLNVRFQIQLHKVIWGDKRGV